MIENHEPYNNKKHRDVEVKVKVKKKKKKKKESTKQTHTLEPCSSSATLMAFFSKAAGSFLRTVRYFWLLT